MSEMGYGIAKALQKNEKSWFDDANTRFDALESEIEALEAEKVLTVNGVHPDGSGNVTITFSPGAGILIYDSVAAFQAANPNGLNIPVYITSTSSWYYSNSSSSASSDIVDIAQADFAILTA